MEISQKATEPKFEPVTIRLDTMQEVRAMKIIVSRSEVCVDPFNIQLKARLHEGLLHYQ